MNIRLSGSERKALATQLMRDIDAACVAHFEASSAQRDHLGASEIGIKCARRLVYAFRWMHRQQFDGRMLRLFERGHLEESRFVKFMQLIGAEINDVDPVTGKQFRVSGHGHFGGSLDGIATLPARYGTLPPKFLTEFKTHGEKSFNKLIDDGVKLSKPQHFSQMCVYGEAYKILYALYFAVNKNTDDIWIEVVELDLGHGQAMLVKAENLISTPHLPNKIAASEAYLDCKFCPMVSVCHRNTPIDVNCRSCRFSMPMQTEPPVWKCQQWNAYIPKDAIPLACPKWEAFT